MVTGPFVDAINSIIDLMLSILNKLNFQIVSGIGFVHLLFAFIIMSIVISVFWKGGRG